MKMPEGWKRFNEGRVKGYAVSGEDRAKAAELLKEFSEALETKGICTKITADKENCAACKVYKKFHDWK